MLGDAVLKMLLVMHYPHESTMTSATAATTAADAGRLNTFVVEHSTNDFLYHRHLDLSRENDLPEGLPPPRWGC
jgi:hypothetical protein